MADVYQPQPVRTLNAGDVKSIIVDSTTPSQGAKVDSSGNQYVFVNNTSAAPIPIQGGNSTAVSSTDAANGPVAAGSAASKSELAGLVYNSSAPTLTSLQQVAMQGDVNGNLKVNLQTAIPAGANLIGATNVYVNGATTSVTNPVPVSLVSNLPGTQVNKYNTSASVAVGAVANHVYTISTGKTFNGKFFTASGSGKLRADLQLSPDGTTYTTYFTQFSSPVMPNIQIPLDLLTLSDSGTGATVRIQITNEDTAVFDVFSTICGIEN